MLVDDYSYDMGVRHSHDNIVERLKIAWGYVQKGDWDFEDFDRWVEEL